MIKQLRHSGLTLTELQYTTHSAVKDRLRLKPACSDESPRSASVHICCLNRGFSDVFNLEEQNGNIFQTSVNQIRHLENKTLTLSEGTGSIYSRLRDSYQRLSCIFVRKKVLASV